ncbi:hypothetical protein GCM10025859_59120 [Alicyclobacillus fastidiosus]|nr:hypothetical protein GCM10025859_59120 [Alicyclobacillus fastidiosus]
MGANAHFLKDRTIEESAKTECREAITNTGDFVIDPEISFYKILQGLLGHAPRIRKQLLQVLT